MQSRSWRCPLLAGALAMAALLTLGGTNTAVAKTLDAASLTSDCGIANGSELAFIDMEPTTPAPNTPDDKQPKTCRINGNCWKPAYCAKEEGTCKGQGVCKAKPETCPADIVEPVCGCNYKTYNSECLAAKAGMNVLHKGKCEKHRK